ncbi:MAG: hypothetical protein LBJ11_08985 [Oscillospiraceae bacterium]|jgi:hypothetical protein|nr:hypothetical protein [Oscillospiraceae bacterium]
MKNLCNIIDRCFGQPEDSLQPRDLLLGIIAAPLFGVALYGLYVLLWAFAPGVPV